VFIDLHTEQRWSARKIFRAKATLALQGAEAVPCRTHDLGASGMSLNLPYPLTVGQAGTIKFDLLVEGKVKPVTASGKVIYCIYSNGEFKIGFKFVNLDLLVLTAIAKFAG
jgi:hypothetical protein